MTNLDEQDKAIEALIQEADETREREEGVGLSDTLVNIVKDAFIKGGRFASNQQIKNFLQEAN